MTRNHITISDIKGNLVTSFIAVKEEYMYGMNALKFVKEDGVILTIRLGSDTLIIQSEAI